MTRALSVAELAAMAAEQEDQTKVVTTGDYERNIPEAGKTVGRLIEYIEMGKRPGGSYLGKEKPAAEKVRLTFELLAPKHIKEYEVEGEKKQRASRISVTLKKSLSDKAKFKKLFNKMTYGRDGIKHIAQMLGEAFIIGVYHNVVKADGKDNTYVNLNPKDGEYDIGAPVITDPLSGDVTKVPVRDALSPIRIFLWNNPTPETWDALFIDGTHTVKDEKGVETEVSNNWMQEMLLGALDYEGSALAQMLAGLTDLPADEEEAAKPAEKGAESASAAQASSAPTGGSNEALAALGLM